MDKLAVQSDLRSLRFLPEFLFQPSAGCQGHPIPQAQLSIPSQSRNGVIPGRVERIILETDVPELFKHIWKKENV